MHYRGQKFGQIRGRDRRILTPNESVLTLRILDEQNRAKIATTGARKDASYFL